MWRDEVWWVCLVSKRQRPLTISFSHAQEMCVVDVQPVAAGPLPFPKNFQKMITCNLNYIRRLAMFRHRSRLTGGIHDVTRWLQKKSRSCFKQDVDTSLIFLTHMCKTYKHFIERLTSGVICEITWVTFLCNASRGCSARGVSAAYTPL
jgi:hypothetical protein